MNTDGDYLWDKSGEPDPEIQELEEILGTLRYQPRPLEIPADLEVGGKRSFFRSLTPGLAIAAAITLFLFGLALWFGLQRLQRIAQPEVVQNAPANPARPAPVESASPNRESVRRFKARTETNTTAQTSDFERVNQLPLHEQKPSRTGRTT